MRAEPRLEEWRRKLVSAHHGLSRPGRAGWWVEFITNAQGRLRHRLPPGEARAGRLELWALLVRQGFRCPYTSEELTPDESTHLDHKVPVSRGGGNTIDNLQWVSKRANQAKSDFTHEEFVAFCRRVAVVHARSNPGRMFDPASVLQTVHEMHGSINGIAAVVLAAAIEGTEALLGLAPGVLLRAANAARARARAREKALS